MDTLNISATANGLNYLPEYLAEATGLFRDAGLAVKARACDPWTGVLDDLESGAADLALGGLWVPGMYAGTPPRAHRDLPTQPPGPQGHRAPRHTRILRVRRPAGQGRPRPRHRRQRALRGHRRPDPGSRRRSRRDHLPARPVHPDVRRAV